MPFRLVCPYCSPFSAALRISTFERSELVASPKDFLSRILPDKIMPTSFAGEHAKPSGRLASGLDTTLKPRLLNLWLLQHQLSLPDQPTLVRRRSDPVPAKALQENHVLTCRHCPVCLQV